MDSLLFLCTRRIVAQRPLPAPPPHLYPVLFQVAFLDGRALVLRDLVATWPFPELHVQQLVGRRKLLRDHSCTDCVQAVIQGVVDQLQRELEEPRHQSSLCVLDMTRLSDSVPGSTPDGLTIRFSQNALAKACLEVSKHQQEFQRHGSKWLKGRSGDATSTVAPQPLGVDVHTDLFVDIRSYGILRDVHQTGAAGPLCLKCREFHAVDISACDMVTLLESLDPSCLRRVRLCCDYFGLAGLSVILPHLSRFPELRSLKLQDINVDEWHLTPELAMRMHCLAGHLGMLSSLRELNLRSTRLSGNLSQILCDLQAPLESLELGYCSLLPADLAFFSKSFHAPALKRLDLSGHNISHGLLLPIQLLLEETSASLLSLDLSNCRVTDSHLAALLPTLLRCSRLRFLGLYGNHLSTAAVKNLLQKTLELLHLQLVVYPYPLDCHTLDPSEYNWNSFRGFVDEELLSAATVEISQLLVNSGRTDLVWTDDPNGHEAPDYFSL